MLFLILIQTLLISFLNATVGLKIVFDPLSLTSPCIQSLRNGTDNITLTGTVEGNFSALINSHWNPFLTIQISDPLFQFTEICSVPIGIDGFFCDPLSTQPCYCDHSNSTAGWAHFVVKLTAQQKYCGRNIRAQWQHPNGSVINSSNSILLPTIYEKPVPDEVNIPLIVCLSVIIPFVVIGIYVVAVCCYKKNKKKSKAFTNGGTDESRPKGNKQEHHETNGSAPKGHTRKNHAQDGQPSQENINQGFDRRTSPSSITVETTPDNSPQQHTVNKKNGSNKQLTGKTNGSASKDTSGEPRRLPPLKGTHNHQYLQEPLGQS